MKKVCQLRVLNRRALISVFAVPHFFRTGTKAISDIIITCFFYTLINMPNVRACVSVCARGARVCTCVCACACVRAVCECVCVCVWCVCVCVRARARCVCVVSSLMQNVPVYFIFRAWGVLP